MKLKPAQYGSKIFMMNDSSTWCMFNTYPYVGTSEKEKVEEKEWKQPAQTLQLWVTVIVRTVSQHSICMKTGRSSPLSPQNGATMNLRLGTVCEVLVFDYAGAEVAKYERSMWEILAGLKKFAKVSESLIKFLYFLKLRSLTVALPIQMCRSQNWFGESNFFFSKESHLRIKGERESVPGDIQIRKKKGGYEVCIHQSHAETGSFWLRKQSRVATITLCTKN